jgi:predicted NBD/HSP70 family sugar kinase
MGLKGMSHDQGRPYNRRVVLETIRVRGPLTRADIARHVLMTTQTVANAVADLQRAGLVEGERASPRGRGQPSITYRLIGEGAAAIGLAVSPTTLRASLVSVGGRSIAQDAVDLPSSDPDTVFPLMGRLVATMASAAGGVPILGVGLAMPGPFGVEGMSFVGSTTMAGWRGVSVRERLEAETGLPVYVGMDAAAAAACERLYGAGRRLKHFFFVYFTAGTGGAFVQDDHFWAGSRGNAGEFGHLPVTPDGELCDCGNRGCLERTVSLDALSRRFAKAGLPFRVDTLDAPSPAAERVIADWISDAAAPLSRALVSVENLLDPEAIIIGGTMPPALIKRLIAAMEPLPPSVASHADRAFPRLMPSEVGPAVAQIGAATFAIDAVTSPRFGQLFLADAVGRSRKPFAPEARP